MQRQLRLTPADDRLGIVTRSMAVRADTLRETDHSVEAVVVSAERKVRVFDWERFAPIDEVLVLDGARLIDGVPLLDAHRRYSFDDVLGHAAEWGRSAAEITARTFFDIQDERAAKAYNKVKGGHLRAVSVGYEVLRAHDIPPGETATVGDREWSAGELWLRISTEWVTREVSLVPVGADDGAKFRRLERIDPTIDYRFAAVASDQLAALCDRLRVQRADLVAELRGATGLPAAELNQILCGLRACPGGQRETIAAVLEFSCDD